MFNIVLARIDYFQERLVIGKNLHIVSYNDKTLQDENMLTNMTFPYKTLILS